MKKLFLFAAAAALLAACSSKDDLSTGQQPQQPAAENNGSIGFDAYLERGTTRAGLAEQDINNTNLATQGFGVFAYYTDNRDYDQLATPNFMYNTHVTKPSTTWDYSPVMYWPNEYGSNAISDDNDKVSFFAYAPYVPVEVASGKLTSTAIDAGEDKWGITSMTRNTASGDPIIKYIASFDNKKAVDLLWGVCNQADWSKIQAGEAQQFTVGKPWLNVERPAGVDQKLKFTFKHATAKMTIKVNEFTDDYKANGNLDDASRIFIRSVRFTGFTMQGALNLDNETANKPYWMNYNGIGDLVADGDVVVYDQRKDGKEATGEATNEKVGGLNPQFIEDETAFDYTTTPTTWASAKTGVTATLQNLFNKTGGAANDHFYVIPTGDPMQIEIVYDVETIDGNLGAVLADAKTPGSSVQNRITKTIEFGNGIKTLEAGKAYTINLHLGMNSVKFEAAVTDWDEMAAPDIDLPANMPAYKANTTTGQLDIPGAATETVLAVYGLKGGESVTATATNAILGTLTYKVNSTGDFSGAGDGRANASGVAYVQVTGITPNNTISDITGKDITVNGAVSGTTTVVNVTQKAQPLALGKPSTLTSASEYTLTTARTISDWQVASTGGTDDATIKVWCDGAELTVVVQATDTAPDAESKVAFNKSAGKLIFKSARTTGQVIKVTIKAGDVPEETISFTIG